jgi:hypothetical protein
MRPLVASPSQKLLKGQRGVSRLPCRSGAARRALRLGHGCAGQCLGARLRQLPRSLLVRACVAGMVRSSPSPLKNQSRTKIQGRLTAIRFRMSALGRNKHSLRLSKVDGLLRFENLFAHRRQQGTAPRPRSREGKDRPFGQDQIF